MPPTPKYNPEYHDDWAWSLAAKGAIDDEIADAFGISVRTLHRWKQEYPSFLQALTVGKEARPPGHYGDYVLAQQSLQAYRRVGADPEVGTLWRSRQCRFKQSVRRGADSTRQVC